MYSFLGKYYDALVDEKYYEKWYKYVIGIIGERKTGLDAGCGSGRFTTELARAGKEMTGCDISDEMLSKAFDRAKSAGVKVRLVKERAEKLRLPHPVDFVVAMNDVVNYMKDPTPFFASAAANLKKGGLMLFDVSSAYKLREQIASHTFCLESENTVCVWESSPLCGGSLEYELKFFTKTESGLYRLEEERQTQYVHEEEKLRASLTECGFAVKVYGELTKRKPEQNATRLHFLAVKGSVDD